MTDPRTLIEARLSREQGAPPTRDTPFCLLYPSPYRVGMSSLGFQTLYRILNAEGVGAHRAFLPDEWEPAALPWPAPRQAILAYESGRPVSDYRVIGLSVAYELEVTGIIRALEGAGIPVLAADRGPRDPIIIAGGPLTDSNPAVVLPFVDLLICGEAEVELPLALDRILGASTREAGLEAAAASPHACLGEVAPGLFEPIPLPASAPLAVLPARSSIVTPDTELSDMFLIEPERGCSRGCTFCVMRGESTGGMRLFDPDVALPMIPEHAKRVGLVGAAVTDHPKLESLVDAIVSTGRGVGISSLRADRLTPRLLDNLSRGGYRQITVASDGISERQRLALKRKITADDLRGAARMVGEHQALRGLKVYQMIGAPGENEDDVDELIEMSRELASLVPLTLTFSTFVAKQRTPLDGQPFLGVKAAGRRLAKIRKALHHKIKIRPQSPRWAHIEYMVAQRGPEAGHAALQAVHAGGRYADWVQAFAALGPNERTLVFGDEARRAARKGRAAKRRQLPTV